MAEFVIGIPGKICCPEKCNAEVTAGDQIRVVMDVAKYPGITDPGIDLTVISVTPGTVCDPDTGALESGKYYTVTVPDDEMPGGLKQIEFCDIISWKCRGCCEDLLALIEGLEAKVFLSELSFVSGVSNEGENTITVTLTASQIAAGYTTAHIIGVFYETLVSTSEISLTDTLSKTATSVVFRLSGIETEDNGHQITLTLRKSPVSEDWSSINGISNAGDNTITVTLTAGQQAAGFTTAHIVGTFYETLASTSEIGATDTLSKTATSVVFRLSGVETENNGHQMTIYLRK